MLLSRSTEAAVRQALPIIALVTLTAASVCAKDVWLRGTHFIIYEVEAGEEVAFTVTPQARGTAGPQPIRWQVYDAEGALIAEAPPQMGALTARYTPRRSGLNIARLTGGRNWYVIEAAENSQALAGDSYGILASDYSHQHTCGDARPIHFYVPEGVEHATVFVLSDRPPEGLTFRLLDPDGNLVAEEAGGFNRPTKIEVPVAEGHDGRVWAINLAPAEGFRFDDVVLWFEADGEIPPLTAYNPEALERLVHIIPGALPVER